MGDGGDWFFPYRHKVGMCIVPVGQPEGTLVLTGGMNGCTLTVYQHSGNFYFYHDNNGLYLRDMNPGPPGELVCNVPYRSYGGPLDIGQKQATDLTKSMKMPVNFQHTLITVRSGARWKVYVTGVHSYGITGKHSKFTPGITSLITSFADE